MSTACHGGVIGSVVETDFRAAGGGPELVKAPKSGLLRRPTEARLHSPAYRAAANRGCREHRPRPGHAAVDRSQPMPDPGLIVRHTDGNGEYD
jgi:hypothetical protein